MKKEKVKFSPIVIGILVVVLLIAGALILVPKFKNQANNENNFLLGEKPKNLISTDDWLKFETSAPFTFSYPTTWGIEAVAGEGGQAGVRAVGPEGEVVMHWGTGFGGACDEKVMVELKLGAETVKACNEARSDGTENWRLISKQITPEVGYEASASARNPADQNRDMILRIFSTVKFNPEHK